MDFALMRKGELMYKVPNGQDPYSAIGKYIRDHITAIEDIIAVIKINEVETNQLFTVDINEENYFIWENDWWEGEEDVALLDFFPVSDAERIKWIPVEERLPQENEVVLISDELGIRFGRIIDKDYKLWEWLFEHGFDFWDTVSWDVYAWMPLPEPYQAERREDG